jgi:hypothetical protein
MNVEAKASQEIMSLLEAEITVISRIYDVQKALHDRVMDRDWDEMKGGLLQINGLVAEFSHLDKRLDDFVASYGQDSIFSLVQCAEEKEDKEKLNSLCATLKRKLTLSKYENEAFNNYVTHAQDLARGVVDSLQEATAGSSYSYNGSRKRYGNSTGGLVLDQTL